MFVAIIIQEENNVCRRKLRFYHYYEIRIFLSFFDCLVYFRKPLFFNWCTAGCAACWCSFPKASSSGSREGTQLFFQVFFKNFFGRKLRLQRLVKFLNLSQKGVLWTDFKALLLQMGPYKRGVKRGSSGPHIPISPFRSSPPPHQADPGSWFTFYLTFFFFFFNFCLHIIVDF